jgi:hypothetical protein
MAMQVIRTHDDSPNPQVGTCLAVCHDDPSLILVWWAPVDLPTATENHGTIRVEPFDSLSPWKW